MSIEQRIELYNDLKAKIKLYESELKIISDEIKSYSNDYGTKDSNGSMFCKTDNYKFGISLRKKITLNKDKALDFLKEKQLTSAVKMVEEVDEEVLEQLVVSGEIEQEEFNNLLDIKEIPALSITKIDVPVVEETKFSLSKKKGSKRK